MRSRVHWLSHFLSPADREPARYDPLFFTRPEQFAENLMRRSGIPGVAPFIREAGAMIARLRGASGNHDVRLASTSGGKADIP
jgi:hypothetical protein